MPPAYQLGNHFSYMAQKKKTKKSKPKAQKKSVKKAVRAVVAAPENTSGLIPLGDRLVLRHLTEDETGTRSASGIIIPDTVSKEKPEQGIVVAVGKGKYEDGELIPMSVKVGDRVVYSKYGFDEVKVGGIEYCVVSESSVLAILKN